MTGRAWYPEEDRAIRKFYADSPTHVIAKKINRKVDAIYRRAHQLGLHKSAAYMDSPHACRLRRGDNVGAAFRFRPGQTPANKGTRRPGWSPGRMATTQFKKGQVPRNTMPMWSFRLVDGYLMLKTGAPTPKPTTGWEYVHKLIWEQANGPLPSWRVARLWWKDGDHGNCSLANLELVTAQEHMRRTTIHTLPPELKGAILTLGQVKRRIREKVKRESGQEQVG